MDLIRTIDNVKYVMTPLKDLDKIKKVTIFIGNIEKFKTCARNCPALSKLKRIVGEI